MVDTDEDETEKPSLSEVASEVVQSIRLLTRKAKENLKKGDAKSFAKGADMALKAANAQAKVLESARKLQQDGVAVIKAMSFIERLELFADWVMSLPPSYQAKLMSHLQQLQAKAAKALPEKTEDAGPGNDS